MPQVQEADNGTAGVSDFVFVRTLSPSMDHEHRSRRVHISIVGEVEVEIEITRTMSVHVCKLAQPSLLLLPTFNR